ncbi:UNVERIFIED_CONTAM: hypothetical protein PYX00_007120 [Menopon gallinae]|uniref:Epidermal cell surface receptor n=1 Tax=Menopon gallinae TaxID=328185 RepID=A0AAW2HIK7_9NEOP
MGENKTRPLDDLSLDDVPMLVMHTTTPTSTNRTSQCTDKDGKKYTAGQKFEKGCDERCECSPAGEITCKPRCEAPFFRKSLTRKDSLCQEIPTSDECCVIVRCTQDTEAESMETCVHKNQTFHKGEMFNDGCEAICSCGDGGKVQCKPRCPQSSKNSSDQCVHVPDPADPCCTVVFCDVTLNDQDVNKITGTEETMSDQLRLKSADALNSTSAIIHFLGEPELESNLTAEVSEDQMKWNKTKLDGVIIHDLQPGKTYYIRVVSGGMVSNAVTITLPKNTPEGSGPETTTMIPTTTVPSNETKAHNATGSNSAEESSDGESCSFKGMNYTLGQEFNDACESYCICTENGVHCSPIECPSEFGLDLLNPHCLKWETRPRDFNPVPPHCCPDKVRCLDDGSCKYMDQVFPNWDEIPTSLTGCEKKCYCEYGNITCHQVCPPVTATPPADLPCPAQQAMLHHLPGDTCCLYWTCPQIQHPGFSGASVPPGFPGQPAGHPSQSGVNIQVLEPLDEHTVRLAFSVPPVLVGLHGRVEVRYTANKHSQDPSTWELQVLAPPADLIATPQLHFDLGNLLPDTTYSIMIKIILRDLSNTPQSPILTVRTLPSSPLTTLPPQILVDSGLAVAEVNSTWAKMMWRKFSEFELQFIDGVQLRYREKEGKVFSATPLIHRLVTSYTIEDLKPNSSYEVGLFFIPFPGQTTELQSERNIEVQTPLENDPYKFEINLEILTTKATSVEVTWSGVPYPEDKYVNIYRVIYQSETGKEDFNTFKVAKRDSTPKMTIMDLKPTTRYRLWLEAYLTNGRTKKSNVQDFVSKPGTVTASTGPSFQGKLSGTPPTMEPGDYYGPLVAVAILAALAIMAALILLLVLMRKHGQNKAAITSTRKTQSAYDNPSYKVEIQQETMDL